jgi:hypothetical protein
VVGLAGRPEWIWGVAVDVAGASIGIGSLSTHRTLWCRLLGAILSVSRTGLLIFFRLVPVIRGV